MRTYAEYVTAMAALPWHQQWVMFLGAKTDKMSSWDTPLGVLDGKTDVWLSLTESGKLIATLNMNDTFAWACADEEQIVPSDVLLIEQATRILGPRADVEWAARKRGMRPIKETGITDHDWGVFMSDLDALVAAHTEFFAWYRDEA